MARVNTVKSARTDIYRYGKEVKSTKSKSGKTTDRSQPCDKDDTILVKKGETYYWWQFRFGGKHISTTYPKRQQLTQSDFFQQIWDIEDRLSQMSEDSAEDLKSEVENIVSELETLRDEQEEKKNNMPDSLQESATGELLQERYDSIDEMIDEINSIDLDDFEEPDEESEDEEGSALAEWLEDKKSELSNVSYNGN